jgi:hypothetical protein
MRAQHDLYMSRRAVKPHSFIPKKQISGLKFGICLLKLMFWETFATIHIKINQKLSRRQRKQKGGKENTGNYMIFEI